MSDPDPDPTLLDEPKLMAGKYSSSQAYHQCFCLVTLFRVCRRACELLACHQDLGRMPWCRPSVAAGWQRHCAGAKSAGFAALLRTCIGEASTYTCLQVMQSSEGRYNGSLQKRSSQSVLFRVVLQAMVEAANPAAGAGSHMYLAQSTIWARGQPPAPLAALLEDLKTPACLEQVAMQHINLWLSTRCILHSTASCTAGSIQAN